MSYKKLLSVDQISISVSETLPTLREHVGIAFDAISGAFRRLAAISEGGRKLDDHQIVAFKLATLHSELLAARAYLDHVDALKQKPGSAARDEYLAAIYAAEVIQQVHSWFDVHAEELGAEQPMLRPSPEIYRLLWSASVKEAAGLLRSEGVRDRKVFPDDIAEVASMVWDSAMRFVRDQVRPKANALFWALDSTMPREWIDAMAELGVWSSDIDPISRILFSEALAEGMFGGPGSLPTRNYITVEAIDAAYTNRDGSKRPMPDHIARLREQLTSVDPKSLVLSAIAHSEPNAGSDSANIELIAKPSDDGQYYVLDGTKMWCTMYRLADGLFLTARTDAKSTGSKGISLFWVPKEAYKLVEDGSAQGAGPTSGRIEGKKDALICYRGMGGTCTVFFDNFHLDRKWLIGEANQGWVPLMKGFSSGRLQTAARSVGLAQSALELAAEYAWKVRKQFGRFIGEFPEIQMKLVRMAARVQAARQLTYLAAQGGLGSPDLSAAIAKLVATTVAFEVANECVQIHGGMGVSEEVDAARFFLDARLLGIFEGTSEIQKLVIARLLVKEAVERAA